VLQAHNCCSLFVPLFMLWTKSGLSFQLLFHFWHFIECQFWCVRWRSLCFHYFALRWCLLFRCFYTLKFVIWLLCFALCAPCVFVLLSKCCFRGLWSLSFIESKSLTLTKFALDVNFKIITFHTILFFRVWSLNV
jgi:hypothetical protein